MVRRAEKGDIEGILKLLIQVDMVHHNGRPDLFKGPATKYDERQLQAIIADEMTPVFVYEKKGCIVGHAFCVHKRIVGDPVLTDVKTLYIDDICVDEGARRQGIGKALFEYVLNYAGENGFYNVTLNVWSCNPGAQSFYESLGFRPQKVCMEMIL